MIGEILLGEQKETDEIQKRLCYMYKLPGAFETNEGTVLQLRVDAIVRGAYHALRVLAFSHLPNDRAAGIHSIYRTETE